MRRFRITPIFLAAVLPLALAACGDGETDDDTQASCSSEMFDKYGTDAFLAVNQSIIDKAVAAPTAMLGTTFQALAQEPTARVEEFTANLANFLVLVYGGPDNYDGPTMEASHTGLNITSEQYDYFVAEVIVPALAENGVPASDISDCFAPPVVSVGFKGSIIER